ncbi:MAG: trypsin-like peptidase domain-containing protein [Phycisphaerae bacterium]|nr:trypsin-like peptidase domain-containing protein [Phycisphaerae bacterium]
MIRPYLALAQMLAMLGWLCSPASAVDASPTSRGPDLELLRAAQQVFRDAAAKVAPCMVRIDTVGGAQPSAVPGRGSGDDSPSPFQERIGSSFTIADGPTTGLVYASDGWIVASSFNFVRDPSLVSVTLADGRRFAADLVARDQVRKLALLKIDAKDLPEPAWKPLSEVRVGEWVIALGLGLGSEQPSINVGIVSALQRMNRNAVQTDAKLSPANYGGPLVDIEGRVVGICVPMAQRPGELAGAEMYDSGVGFVLPTERVHEIVERLRTGESIYRGWLGIQLDPQARGVARIQKLADPSPLREAGVLPGDHIVRANDRPIRNFQQLVQALYMIPAGDEVVVVTERKGEQRELKIKLARNTDLGPLPAAEEPENPFSPPTEPDDSGGE